MIYKFTDLTPDMPFPEKSQIITQENINYYAKASGDFNPIHINPEFAKTTPLGGTIAHGMLVLAYLSEYMTDLFGLSWITGGAINARFKAPARPGDTVLMSGKIKKVTNQDKSFIAVCELQCKNQNNEPVILAEASVTLPS